MMVLALDVCAGKRNLPAFNTERMAHKLFARKPLEQILASGSGEDGHTLKRTLTAASLIALGIGAIIGAGLFVRTAAAAAQNAGPAVTIGFIIAAGHALIFWLATTTSWGMITFAILFVSFLNAEKRAAHDLVTGVIISRR